MERKLAAGIDGRRWHSRAADSVDGRLSVERSRVPADRNDRLHVRLEPNAICPRPFLLPFLAADSSGVDDLAHGLRLSSLVWLDSRRLDSSMHLLLRDACTTRARRQSQLDRQHQLCLWIQRQRAAKHAAASSLVWRLVGVPSRRHLLADSPRIEEALSQQTFSCLIVA